MKNISKLALLVAAGISAQAFALDKGEFSVGGYGKLGASSQLDADKAGQVQLNSQTDEDFTIYQNTKAGINLGYGITNNISVHGEVKADFQGHDAHIDIEQLNVQADFGKVDATLGRMRTPLYMNSLSLDDDFANASFAGPRFFTQNEAFDNFDGAKVGFTQELQAGKFNTNVMYGIAKDREVGTYDKFTNNTLVTKYDAENIIGVDANLATKFGQFRVAYFQADFGFAGAKLEESTTTSFGYAYDSGKVFANAEIALDQADNLTDVTKGYVTVGTRYGQWTPSVTYSQYTSEVVGESDPTGRDIEVGLAYDVNKNIRFKTSYEYIKQENDVLNRFDKQDDNVVNLGVAFKL